MGRDEGIECDDIGVDKGGREEKEEKEGREYRR